MHRKATRPSTAARHRSGLTLGLESEGWDRRRAEEELANVLADVRRGIWVPPQRRRQPSEEMGEVPLFGPFASELVASREGPGEREHAALR